MPWILNTTASWQPESWDKATGYVGDYSWLQNFCCSWICSCYNTPLYVRYHSSFFCLIFLEPLSFEVILNAPASLLLWFKCGMNLRNTCKLSHFCLIPVPIHVSAVAFFPMGGQGQGTFRSGCIQTNLPFLLSLFQIIKNNFFSPSFYLWNNFIKIRQENILTEKANKCHWTIWEDSEDFWEPKSICPLQWLIG